jgi:hypothetical protein
MTEKNEQILFYIIPIAGQLLFTVAAFFLPWAFARHHTLAYLSAVLMAPPTILAMIMLVRHQWTNGWVIASLTAQGILVLVHFAIVHHAVGFQPSAVPSDSFWDALYYSIVTWTTLGYGDIVPVRELRMFAAIEALYGYIFLGLIVGVLSARFRN